jgi:hypothetical protein
MIRTAVDAPGDAPSRPAIVPSALTGALLDHTDSAPIRGDQLRTLTSRHEFPLARIGEGG